jgi:hypothetical protein
VLHVALWLPITLLGAFFMLRESIGWRDIDRALEATAAETPAPPSGEIEAPQPLHPPV